MSATTWGRLALVFVCVLAILSFLPVLVGTDWMASKVAQTVYLLLFFGSFLATAASAVAYFVLRLRRRHEGLTFSQRRQRLYDISAIAGLVPAIVAASVSFMTGLFRIVDDFHRAPVPSTVDITLEDVGTYTGFIEVQSEGSAERPAANSVQFRVTTVPEVEIPTVYVLLTSLASGDLVEMRAPQRPIAYVIKDRTLWAAFEFDIDTPGNYRLDTDPASDVSSKVTVGIVVGQADWSSVIRAQPLGFALAGLLALGGVASLAKAISLQKGVE